MDNRPRDHAAIEKALLSGQTSAGAVPSTDKMKKIISFIKQCHSLIESRTSAFQRAKEAREEAEKNETEALNELRDVKLDLLEVVYVVSDLKKSEDIEGFFFSLTDHLRLYLVAKEMIKELAVFLDQKENKKLLGNIR